MLDCIGESSNRKGKRFILSLNILILLIPIVCMFSLTQRKHNLIDVYPHILMYRVPTLQYPVLSIFLHVQNDGSLKLWFNDSHKTPGYVF